MKVPGKEDVEFINKLKDKKQRPDHPMMNVVFEELDELVTQKEKVAKDILSIENQIKTAKEVHHGIDAKIDFAISTLVKLENERKKENG